MKYLFRPWTLPWKIAAIFAVPMPFWIKRMVLTVCCGYRISPKARIGWSLILAETVEIEAGARIGHLNVIKGLTTLVLRENAVIARGNWVYGQWPKDDRFFLHQVDRRSELIVGREAAITSRHIIDCTNKVKIGAFSTIAGYRSQFLTHSIDLEEGRQHSAPISVGEYCFVGTSSIILGGAILPDGSVLGACSLLNRAHTEPRSLYAGVPARRIKPIPSAWGYLSRKTGAVH